MQHIRSKHGDQPEPSRNELREAARSIKVSKKNGQDEGKHHSILDTVEVEDNTNPERHEERCESVQKIVPKIMIKHTKPTKKWITRGTKNVFSCSDANLLRY